MTHPTGETNDALIRVDFDRRLMLQFRGSVVTSDAGLIAYRELDDALGLSAMAVDVLADARTGKNGRHALVAMLRQSVCGRLAGYEDVNDAERLRHYPAMRWIVSGKAMHGSAASASQMGRFETSWYEKCVSMTKYMMPFSPRTCIGPSGSLSAWQFGPAMLPISGNSARSTGVPASTWGMSGISTYAARSTKGHPYG